MSGPDLNELRRLAGGGAPQQQARPAPPRQRPPVPTPPPAPVRRGPSAFGRFLRFVIGLGAIAAIVYGGVQLADRTKDDGTGTDTRQAQIEHDVKKVVRSWGRARTARTWCSLMTPAFRRTVYSSDTYSSCRRDATRQPVRRYRFTSVQSDGGNGVVARAQNVRTKSRSAFHLVPTDSGWRLDSVTGPW